MSKLASTTYIVALCNNNIIDCTVPIQSQPTTDPSVMVGCTTDRSCGGNLVTSSIKDCCDHDIEPSGFAYTIPGVDGCNLCPVGKTVNCRIAGNFRGEISSWFLWLE